MALGIHPELERGTPSQGNAAFIAFICRDVLQYEDAPEEYHLRGKRVTLLGMNMRWDSTQGFPGGIVEKGETLIQAAIRECKEETGHTVDRDELRFLCTHKVNGGMNSHLYVCRISRDRMYQIQKDSLTAEHGRVESAGFLIHHLQKNSFQNLIESSLAKTVREQLYTLDQRGQL